MTAFNKAWGVVKADDPPLGVHEVFDAMQSHNLEFMDAVGQVSRLLSLDGRKLLTDCQAYSDSGATLFREGQFDTMQDD